jgi:hypothetical protein
VAHPRHKHVLRAAKPRRRLLRVGLPTAAVLALGAPAAAVVWPNEEPVEAVSAAQAETTEVRTTPVPVREAPISRSETRVRLEEKPPEVVDHEFATTKVNVRAEPSEAAPLVDVLDWAAKVAVSGETVGEWAEVVIDGESYWVHSAYLAEKKPRPEAEAEDSAESSPTGLSTAACATGSDVESGLVSNAIAVHRAVCAAFPEVTSFGGLRPGDTGEHGTGQALDIMISGEAGWEVAEYVRENADALGVSEVLYSQKIWTVERSSEGWRWMEDRGSTTANHYDHVHVSVY